MTETQKKMREAYDAFCANNSDAHGIFWNEFKEIYDTLGGIDIIKSSVDGVIDKE